MNAYINSAVASLALTALAAAPASAQERSWEWGMHPMTWMWGAGGLGMMLVFWALVITGIVLGVRWLARSTDGGGRSDAALEILRQRYARGEVDRQEFEAKRRDLT